MQAYPDEVEERIVNEEYKVWKKNTPFLYGEHAGLLRRLPWQHVCMQWAVVPRSCNDMCSLHCKSIGVV